MNIKKVITLFEQYKEEPMKVGVALRGLMAELDEAFVDKITLLELDRNENVINLELNDNHEVQIRIYSMAISIRQPNAATIILHA